MDTPSWALVRERSLVTCTHGVALGASSTLMDVMSSDWLHGLEMEEDPNLMLQCQMDSVDHLLDEITFKCFSPEAYSFYASLNNGSAHIETDILELAGEIKSNANNDNFDNNENVVLFGQSGSPSTHSESFNGGDLRDAGTPKDDEMASQDYMNLLAMSSPSSEENIHDTLGASKRVKKVCATSRAPLQAENRILAERKRRERLNQKLICLSALIPSLKKMDKASILEDAIEYIKQLKEHVQTLEKEAKEKMVEPTALPVKNKCGPPSAIDDDDDENLSKKLSAQIDVKVSDNNVLVRIYCEKSNFVTPKLLTQIQGLHLNIITSIVLPFGNTSLVITIIAQMENEFYLTGMDVEKNLRSAIQNFM
ncbi:transcription factor bHLH19-like isoform X1 [Camellia sinensis]|uniref:transcription factor bHLH19-like isoform X1 n=2 Tax=Camellia sinensis TaxID=4442 RepID=UPI00103561C0|nr:transcription factor bHLH19-like isoform X1 [Camellia sinensis]